MTQPLWSPSPPSIVAAGEAPVMPFSEPLLQRLLRHRIIMLGQQVDNLSQRRFTVAGQNVCVRMPR